MELNPNHPVTREVHDQWHKFVAIIMAKLGLTEIEITVADLALLGDNEKAVVADMRGGRCFIRLVTMEEGERLAREEGAI